MPPVRTNIVEIGGLIEARLNTLLVVPDPSQILWSARKGSMPHLKGKKDLVIRPRRGQDLRSFEQGGQRFAMVCVRVIDIIMRTSLATGEAGSDKTWYEQHIPFEDAVLNALAGQMLSDRDGNEYLTEPMKYLGTTEETKEEDIKPKSLFGNSCSSFECHYKPKIDPTKIYT